MPDSTICLAVKRVEDALTQKPGRGPQPDVPAQAVLTGGLGMEVRHPSGHTLLTDMPTSLGGSGQEVSPGWLMRAGLASCTATVIALRAERLGIRLTKLEVTARSSSDARGMLGLDPSVSAGLHLDMQVDIQAETPTSRPWPNSWPGRTSTRPLPTPCARRRTCESASTASRPDAE